MRNGDALIFGVVSGDRLARASLAQVCDAVAKAAEQPISPLVAESYGVLEQSVERGSVALAWAPPLVAQRLIQKSLVVPVACPVRPGGMTYHSVLFVRAGSRLKQLSNLRKVRAAWVDPSSLSGGVLARRFCERQSASPETLFASESYVNTHSAVARAVLEGSADVGATYANVDAKSGRVVDAGWSEVGAKLEDVHVIATIGPIPADAIVVARRVPDAVREGCARALLSLGGAAIGAARSLFRAERFDRTPPDYVSQLARVL